MAEVMSMAPVPLDEQQVTEPDHSCGNNRTLPALHPLRKVDRHFVHYKVPPLYNCPAETEEFLEHAKFIIEDLEWLLMLPHDKFWCQVVFDESLQRCLDSYLHYAPRGLELTSCTSSPSISEMQQSIHRAVFLTYLRMATHKESKENFLTPAVFGEIIYENFLFDIPKIMDLCVLFGKGNNRLLHKMIENIFAQQPSYYSDLDEIVPSVLQVFDTILLKCGHQCEGASAMEPQKLRTQSTAMTMSQQELVDLIFYLCDLASTIHAFLDIFPAACSIFQSHGFLSRLPSFYETAVPDLEKAVRKRNFPDKSVQESLWKTVSHSCRKMVETAHQLLHHIYLQPIQKGGENCPIIGDELLQHFTSFLPEKRFLLDYNNQFPMTVDLRLLQKTLPAIDETRVSYILHGVESAFDSVVHNKDSQIPSIVPFEMYASQAKCDAAVAGSHHSLEENHRTDQDAGCPLSEAELESLLSCIRDLLPDLGEGFLLACLQEYNFNYELVINNILEERLTPELKKLDRTMPRPTREELPAVLSNRSNVFDDDEFDIFCRDHVDMSRIWKGARKVESARDTVNDKRHIEEQRIRYKAYETVVDEVVVETESPPGAFRPEDYDDEYDDTYDMNQVGANDLDGDSLLNQRPIKVPLVLQMGRKVGLEDGEVDDVPGEEEIAQNIINKDQFVQDPAVLREMAEARRAAIQQRRGFHPERRSHVVGNPKGQGQTLQTYLDRRNKEANKSRSSNHNRRVMADRKRNKGMIPS